MKQPRKTHKHRWAVSVNTMCHKGSEHPMEMCEEGDCRAYRCLKHKTSYDLVNHQETNVKVNGRAYRYI